jgi:hypothetical protein
LSLTISIIAAGVLATAFWMGGSPGALAQSTANQPGSGDEFHVLNANVTEIEEGESLAQTRAVQQECRDRYRMPSSA